VKQLLIQQGRLTVADVPAPLVEPGHVLVEVGYSVISSGTELSIINSAAPSLAGKIERHSARLGKLIEHLRSRGVKQTIALVRGHLAKPAEVSAKSIGYSCAGRVVAVGEGVAAFAPGDLVACAGAGIANHAELVLVPTNLVARVPVGCGLKAAAAVAIGAIALQGVRRADLRLGEQAAVIGLGLLGQLTAQILRAAGCRTLGIDVDPSRVELARATGLEFGFTSADEAMSAARHWTGGHGVDATIIAAAASKSNEIVQQAMHLTRRKGRIVIVGAVGMDVQRSPFYEKELDLVISCSYGPGRYDDHYERDGADYPYEWVRWTENRNFGEYLRLVAEHRIDVSAILSTEVDFADAPRAYDLLNSNERPLAVALRYPLADEADTAKQSPTLRLQPTRADGKIGVALVGPGSFARGMHLPNLKALGELFHLRSVVGRSGATAKAVASSYGADTATTDLAETLADPAIDAVVICTRHALHAEQVVAALSAGKHVYCEKPLCLSEAELASILDVYGLSIDDVLAGRAADLLAPILTVGFNRRFAPATDRLRRSIAGRQNPLVALYRVNAGWIDPQSWVHGPEGGGRIVGEGCHMIDWAVSVTGSPVADVRVTPLVPRGDHILASDNASIALAHADGSVSTIVYSSLGSPQTTKEHIEVLCDGQSYTIDDFRESSGAIDKGHRQALAAFGRAIRDGGPWPIPLRELVSVTRATLEIGRVLAHVE